MGPRLVEPADGAPAWIEATLPAAGALALAADPVACAAALRVFTAAAADEGGPPLLGTADCDGARARFTPRFPLAPGLAYRAVLDLSAWDGPRLATEIRGPDRRGVASTRVVLVTPSGPVPENLLKLYVHFSAPMQAGRTRAGLRLVDAATGVAVTGAFAEGTAELWDPERRRLTLLLDPGRIKQGLRGQAEAGPPLRAGRRYRLEIARELKDASGLPLAASFAHEFAVAAADHVRPDPNAWALDPPRAGGREPPRVRFPEALDHALLSRALAVLEGEERLAGQVEIEAGERGWRFTPEAPWARGAHALAVDPRLEDLAGNNLGRAFDRDLRSEPAAPAMPPPVRLPFAPRP